MEKSLSVTFNIYKLKSGEKAIKVSFEAIKKHLKCGKHVAWLRVWNQVGLNILHERKISSKFVHCTFCIL